MGDIKSLYLETSGLWWKLRYVAITETIFNLILNYCLGKYLGIYGIISATLFSLFFINFCFGSKIVFKHYFKNQKLFKYFYDHFRYASITFTIALITLMFTKNLNFGMYINFIISIILVLIIPLFLYNLFYYKD